MTTKDAKRKPPQFQMITEILVRRGLAVSLKAAEAMVRDERVETPQSGGIVINPKAEYRFNEPVRILADARVVVFDPSKQSADRPAAKSGYPRPTSGDEDESPSAGTSSGGIGQVDLEEIILRRRELMDVEERIMVALSKGAHVEPGIHTAELVMLRDEDGTPVRDESGQLSLKLVIR